MNIFKHRKKRLIIAETKDFSDKAIACIPENVEVTQKEIGENELQCAFREYDYFWFRLGFRITDELLRVSGRRVSVIICPVTGLDHIDVETCNELNIRVISLKGQTDFLRRIKATAELTIGLTLALLRNLPQAINSVRQDIWDRDAFKGREINGKQVGIIGMGRLGKIVADYFLAFGARVFAYDIKDFTSQNVTKVRNIRELVSQSDIITLHVDYNEENHHLIDDDLLNEFKKGSVFINTSRGSLVDSNALINALRNGHLSGAALDVIENEFALSNRPLIDFSKTNDHLIITPHIGGNTTESFEKTEIYVATKLCEYVQNNE